MIRKATIKDQQEVLNIYKEAQEFIKSYNSPQWQNDYPNVRTFLEDVKKEQIYVSVKDGKIVGAISLLNYERTYEKIEGSWLNDDLYVVIHRLCVKNDCLGKGYAKEFLDYIEEELDFKNIKVDTHELNEPMKKFLLKNGFVYCGIIELEQKFDKKRLAYQKVL